MVKMFIGIHVKCPLYLSDCIELEYSRQIFEKYHISHLMKWEPSCSMQAEGRTSGQTDRHDESNSRFSQFCERA